MSNTITTTTTETYTQMKARHQKEVDALPIFFAFSDSQFEEGCKRYGVTEPHKELFRLGGGGFYRKSDSGLIRDTFLRQKAESKNAMKTEEYAISAYIYEMGNHEFHIGCDPHFDMANCFGYPTTKNDWGSTVIDWSKVENGEFLHKCYVTATKKFLATAQY